MENVVTVIFNVESEAYQAFSELKREVVNDAYVISQMELVKKEYGRIISCEGYDTGITTTDDTSRGGLIGMFTGVLAGPLGMLFGGAMGTLIGSAIDAEDAVKNISMIERVSRKLGNGETALIALVMEENVGVLDTKLQHFKTTIIREDAALVAQEIEDARELQLEMEKEAKKKMREKNRMERRREIDEKRLKIKADFDKLKNKLNKT